MGGTRSYTNEQIQFVLDAWIDGKKAPEIVQAYRQTFGDQRFGVSQCTSGQQSDATLLCDRRHQPLCPDLGRRQSVTERVRSPPDASRSPERWHDEPVASEHAATARWVPGTTDLRTGPLATMSGFDFGGSSSFSGGVGLMAPGLAANAGTTPAASSMAAAGMSAASISGPRSVPFGATRPPHGPVAQSGSPGPDKIMTGIDSIINGRSMSGPGAAFWSGPGLGSSSLAQKGAAGISSATAPFGNTSGSIPDANIRLTTTTTTPALASFPSSSAGLAGKAAEPPTSAWAMQAGKAPEGGSDQKTFLLAPAPEAPHSTSGSSEDWVVLSPRAGPGEEEEMIGLHNTTHHGCPIEASHRHDPDGGIHFSGMRDLRQAMTAHLCARLEEVSRLERCAHLAAKGARDDDFHEEEGGERQQQQDGARSGAPEPSTAPGSVAGEDTAMEQCELEG
ncbi:hypothetical protein PG996_005827 [Apiospora saccharicola]|uniref:Uncharacterized protein n=1 Tax=Apiospora saccharicola TaxID=335842 RepID=A0ABR1VML4_9PEZI